MKGLGDSNTERNAHDRVFCFAIFAIYNYKEFIMKKLLFLFMTVSL